MTSARPCIGAFLTPFLLPEVGLKYIRLKAFVKGNLEAEEKVRGAWNQENLTLE